MSKVKLILNAFWHRFWDDFRGPRNVKNEEKRGRVALFLLFGVCKIRCRFGAVLDWSGGGFWNLFARFWLDSEALKQIRSLRDFGFLGGEARFLGFQGFGWILRL